MEGYRSTIGSAVVFLYTQTEGPCIVLAEVGKTYTCKNFHDYSVSCGFNEGKMEN